MSLLIPKRNQKSKNHTFDRDDVYINLDSIVKKRLPVDHDNHHENALTNNLLCDWLIHHKQKTNN